MIGIIVCCCYKYKNQHEKISKFWNNIERKTKIFRIFYLFGNPKIKKNEYIEKDKTLILKVDDTYESLPKKIYEAVNYIYTYYPEIEGIFKTDDDIEFENVSELLNELKYLCQKSIDFAGIVLDKVKAGTIKPSRMKKFTNKNIEPPKYDMSIYCYGAGYYLSRKSMSCISSNKNYFYNQYLEDVSTGHILNKYKIYPVQMNTKYKEIIRIK